MFEDLDDHSSYTPPGHNQQQQQPSPPVHNSYNQQEQQRPQPNQFAGNGYTQQNNQGGYQQRPYQQRQQGGFQQGGFQKKEDVVTDAYIPVGMCVYKDFPNDVKEQMFAIASKMIAKKMTIRINADDREFIDRLKVLTDANLEIYLPWRGFNELEGKRTFNTLTSKHVASLNFAGWEKITDAVKAMLAAQVRLVFGDKNNSIVLCLITWSPDGASRVNEVTKETGRSSFIIRMASSFGFPVLNMTKPQAMAMVEKTFNL